MIHANLSSHISLNDTNIEILVSKGTISEENINPFTIIFKEEKTSCFLNSKNRQIIHQNSPLARSSLLNFMLHPQRVCIIKKIRYLCNPKNILIV